MMCNIAYPMPVLKKRPTPRKIRNLGLSNALSSSDVGLNQEFSQSENKSSQSHESQSENKSSQPDESQSENKVVFSSDNLEQLSSYVPKGYSCNDILHWSLNPKSGY